jgi:GntR family transcriptional regulator
MVRFRVNIESPVPASAQLYEQLSFAVASRQLPPGAKLPSVRQLSMQTGLHRNTISKVYNQLEANGMVQARPGSGVYVIEHESVVPESTIQSLIRRTLETALAQGYTLSQVQTILDLEVTQRLEHQAQVLVTSTDAGSLALMVAELKTQINIPVQGMLLGELKKLPTPTQIGLVVTQRYDFNATRQLLAEYPGTVFPVDIHTYEKELELVEQLPKGSALGIVSISPGILRIVEIVIHSMRGEDILLLMGDVQDSYGMTAILNSADLIIADEASYEQVLPQAKVARQNRHRPLKIHCAGNYIAKSSLEALRHHLSQV